MDWGAQSLGKSTGAAAIYGPPDLGFPDTGVLAEGKMNAPGWVFADITTSQVDLVRKKGRVRNFTHWEEQGAWANSPLSVNLRRSELEKH